MFGCPFFRETAKFLEIMNKHEFILYCLCLNQVKLSSVLERVYKIHATTQNQHVE